MTYVHRAVNVQPRCRRNDQREFSTLNRQDDLSPGKAKNERCFRSATLGITFERLILFLYMCSRSYFIFHLANYERESITEEIFHRFRSIALSPAGSIVISDRGV